MIDDFTDDFVDAPPAAAPPPEPAEPRQSRRPEEPPHPADQFAVLPPQNLEAEESILGAMMLTPNAVAAVAEILHPTDFYREAHSKIYRAALAVTESGVPVDVITLANELEQRQELAAVGGKARIQELAALVPTASNAAHYARIVHDLARLRGLIHAAYEMQRFAYERPGDTADLLAQSEKLIFDLTLQHARTELVPLRVSVSEVFETLTSLYENGADVVGVPSGWHVIDRMTSGFQPGNLVIVAARPSMGKSAFGLGIGTHVAVDLGRPVGLFTLEMSRAEVTQRLMSMRAGIDSVALRNGRLAVDDWPKLTSACDRLSKAPFYVDDNSAASILELQSKARRLKMRHPDLACILVDYLQLMSTEAENRVQEVSRISRALKQLAGELEVPVIAMSQLSRQVESRHDKRPLLSDLRESGSIEQDADVVMFLYRDEYYNPEEPESEGIAEVIIAKQRNGPTGTEKLAFVKRYAQFSALHV